MIDVKGGGMTGLKLLLNIPSEGNDGTLGREEDPKISLKNRQS